MQATDDMVAEHAYTVGGIFEIKVTVTDDDGGTHSDSAMSMVTGAGVLDGGNRGVSSSPYGLAAASASEKDGLLQEELRAFMGKGRRYIGLSSRCKLF